MTANDLLFYLLALAAVVAGGVTVTRRHPLSAALSLIVCFISLAGLYALLDAQLVAIIQILVYAGAIMALVVFVIMLLNVRDVDLPTFDRPGPGLALALVGVVPLLAVVGWATPHTPGSPWPAVPVDFGYVAPVGQVLFRSWTFPFELVSVLLTVAVVGAIVLAKRRI